MPLLEEQKEECIERHPEGEDEAFEGALDRFSQFFIAPAFNPDYTKREQNAVNSEFQKNYFILITKILNYICMNFFINSEVDIIEP